MGQGGAERSGEGRDGRETDEALDPAVRFGACRDLGTFETFPGNILGLPANCITGRGNSYGEATGYGCNRCSTHHTHLQYRVEL